MIMITVMLILCLLSMTAFYVHTWFFGWKNLYKKLELIITSQTSINSDKLISEATYHLKRLKFHKRVCLYIMTSMTLLCCISIVLTIYLHSNINQWDKKISYIIDFDGEDHNLICRYKLTEILIPFDTNKFHKELIECKDIKEIF